MSVFSPARLPEDPARAAAVESARLVLQTVSAMLALPVFVHNIPLSVLTKMATDTTLPARERRNASAALATLQLRLVDLQASLTGARELALSNLGLASGAGPASVSLTQVNQVTKIEVVREKDWRDAATSDDRG